MHPDFGHHAPQTPEPHAQKATGQDRVQTRRGLDPTTGQGRWPFQTSALHPRPVSEPQRASTWRHMGALLDSGGRGDSAGRAGVVALDLETPARGRSQHRRRLPWELVASLERVPLPTNSQSSSPPGTVGAMSATSEGKVGRPRSKSCQGWGARAGVRSSFFGKVGFGGREGGSGRALPWACRLGGRTCCWPVPCSWES